MGGDPDFGEESLWVQVVFARFVDNAHHSELVSLPVGNGDIDLSEFQRGVMSLVGHTDDMARAPSESTGFRGGIA